MKEVGIYLVDCPSIAKKVEVYFQNLWKLASLNSSAYTKTVSDNQWQVDRIVPCWSHFLDSDSQCRYVCSNLRIRHFSQKIVTKVYLSLKDSDLNILVKNKMTKESL